MQIVDIMVDIRKMANRKIRSKRITSQGKANLSGILSGALQESDKNQDLTYKVETMGCQMNMADSERMEGQLQSLGIRPIRPEEEIEKKQPDLVLLNTCSIRDRSEQKVYS